MALSKFETVYKDQIELWCRTSALILQEVTPAVQALLDEQIRLMKTNLKSILSKKQDSIDKCANKCGYDSSPKRLTEEQYNKLTVNFPKSTDFDLTLLNFIFKNVIIVQNNRKKVLTFIEDIMTIRNKLFHWVQNLNDANILSKIRAVWDDLVAIMQSPWLKNYKISLSDEVIRKYKTDMFNSNFIEYSEILQCMMENDLVESTKITNVVTKVLENFHLESSKCLNEFLASQNANGFIKRTHYERVKNINKLMTKLPENILEMILANCGIKDITVKLEEHYKLNQSLYNSIESLLQQMKSAENAFTTDDNMLQKSVTETKEDVKIIKRAVMKLNKTPTNGIQLEVLTVSSIRVFWDKVPGVDKYRVQIVSVDMGNTTEKVELCESCDLTDLTQGDYQVTVTAIQNVIGDIAAPNIDTMQQETPLKSLKILVRHKDLIKSTKNTWSTKSCPGDWVGLQYNGQSNTDSKSFMGELQGYMPVRLIPLVGIYLDDPVEKTKVDTWLQSGVRFFYINFDKAVKTELLSIIGAFVKENSTEGIIVMYNRAFTSEETVPSSVQLPDNVVWKFDYTKLKLSDIRGTVVMLDSKKHKLFDNRNIYDKYDHSETPTAENKCWELDFSHLHSNEVLIKSMKASSIDQVSVENTNIKNFLLQHGETLDTCHKHEAPMLVSCIVSDEDEGIFTNTIESNTSFVTCGAVAFHPAFDISFQNPVSRLLLCARRWQNMVKFLLNSIEKQFKLSGLEDFGPAVIQEDLKQGLSPQLIALNHTSSYFSKIIKDEIGTNTVRYHDFLQKLVDQSVINVEHRASLNAALIDNMQYEDDLLAVIYNKIKEMKPELVEAYLDRLLTVLMMNHDTRPLAYLIKELVDKVLY